MRKLVWMFLFLCACNVSTCGACGKSTRVEAPRVPTSQSENESARTNEVAQALAAAFRDAIKANREALNERVKNCEKKIEALQREPPAEQNLGTDEDREAILAEGERSRAQAQAVLAQAGAELAQAQEIRAEAEAMLAQVQEERARLAAEQEQAARRAQEATARAERARAERAEALAREAEAVNDTYNIGKNSTGFGSGQGSTGYGIGKGSTGFGSGQGSTGYGSGRGSTGYGIGPGSTGFGIGPGSTGAGLRAEREPRERESR